MRKISGIVTNDLVIDEPCTISGMVAGDITVTSKGVLTLAGMCRGRIVVQPGGRADVPGLVSGGVHYAQAKGDGAAVAG